MNVPRTALLVALVLLAAAGPPLAAATVLVVSRELLDGEPIPPPRPVVEGALAALFDDGQIAFDAPSPITSLPEIVSLARAAGADQALLLEADCRTLRPPGGAVGLSVDAQVTVIDAATGAALATERIRADNAGRERNVDLAALGAEVGRRASAVLREALGRQETGQQATGSFR